MLVGKHVTLIVLLFCFFCFVSVPTMIIDQHVIIPYSKINKWNQNSDDFCTCIFRLVEESDLEIAKQAFGESTVSLYLKDEYVNIKQWKTIIN